MTENLFLNFHILHYTLFSKKVKCFVKQFQEAKTIGIAYNNIRQGIIEKAQLRMEKRKIKFF